MADSQDTLAEFGTKLDEARWLAKHQRWDDACQAARRLLEDPALAADDRPDAVRRLQDQARALLSQIDASRQRSRQYRRSGYSRAACLLGGIAGVTAFGLTWWLIAGPALATWLAGAAFLAAAALLDSIRERSLLLHCHGAHHAAVVAGAMVPLLLTPLLRILAWGTWSAWMMGSVGGCVVFALLSAWLSRICPPDEPT